MIEDHEEGFDRRDFIIASLGAVGAAAALMTGPTMAQDAAAPKTEGGTVFTGDTIGGKQVISALNIETLEPGRHFFYFQGVQMPTGQHWYVSVAVTKGEKPGKRVGLIGGVHGDEMSPIHTIQKVLAELDPAEMSGSVLAVFDVSRPAVEDMTRRWHNSGRGHGPDRHEPPVPGQ